LWVNANYTGNIFSYTWDSALLLFTIRWVLLAVMIWVVVDPIKLWKNTKGDSDGNSN
jgi:hypothetical protein